MTFGRSLLSAFVGRVCIGIPLECIGYAIFFGGSFCVATWDTWTAVDAHTFFEFGANLIFAFITGLLGVLIVGGTHLVAWLNAVRHDRPAMVKTCLAPTFFALAYLSGALAGKLVGKRFLESFFDQIYYGAPEQVGMLLGSAIVGGLYIFIATMIEFARRHAGLDGTQSSTVTQRAKERLQR